MKVVIFGLTVSSTWGNGHATLWRGLLGALARRGHAVIFFERDVPYYAAHRDLTELQEGSLRFYSHWDDVISEANFELSDADVAIVTSYCPDGIAASDLVLSSATPCRVFYDLDTPVTLDHVRHGNPVSYIGPRGLGDFDLVLSYTGGIALDELKHRLGARRVAPLYGSVDADVHRPATPVETYRADLSYLGTYAEDRQAALDSLFIQPAHRLSDRRFLIAGAQYPATFPWTENIYFVRHLPPAEHPAFYSSSRLTLNITRRAMAEMGYCPSGRLFEAAACGVPILTDWWEGLDCFFAPETELLVARTTEDVVRTMQLSDRELGRIGQNARQRTLEEHTAEHRACQLEDLLTSALVGSRSSSEKIGSQRQ